MDIYERQYRREQDLAQVSHERAIGLFMEQSRNGNGGSCSAAAWITGHYLPISLKGLEYLKEAPNSPTRLLKGLDDLGHRLCTAIAIEAILDALLTKPQQTRTYILSGIADRLDMESIIGSFTSTNPLRAAQLHKRAAKELAGSQKKARMFLTSSESTGDPVLRISKTYGVQLAGILVGLLIGAGMLEESVKVVRGKSHVYLSLSGECVTILTERTRHAGESFGMFSPMLHEPLDWAPGRPGGYSTPQLRDVARLVLGPPSLSKRALSDSSQESLDALNLLQKTPWRVSQRVLEVVKALAAAGELGEIVPEVSIRVPEYPEHLQGISKEDRTPEQQDQHQVWLESAREAHSLRNKQASASIRFVRVIEEANQLSKEARFFFVWAVDSRGRLYPRVYGLSPQGSDLQKALLEFAEPSRITNDRQLLLFQTNLAHRWGYDKASYADTRKWVEDNTEQILLHANNPLIFRDWLKADSPLLYLQAAMGYRDYLKDPENFKSHIPIAADGSCSGSQHMAAMLRDPETAAAVNLRPAEIRNDLYQMTGNATEALLRARQGHESLPVTLSPYLTHGIPRSLVKRPTMTLPYGLTQRSVAGYLFTDYLASTEVQGLSDDLKFKSACDLAPVVWEALHETQKATLDMLDWFRKAAREHYEQQGDPLRISWKTPDGFQAQQFAAEYEDSRIKTWCGSPINIRWSEQGIKPSRRRQVTAFPPNFVHSQDATHLRMVVREMASRGCKSFAMIHDDFGVPVGDSDVLWNVVRETFRDLYNTNTMEYLRDQWNLSLEPHPHRGWQVEEILLADYAFK